MTAKRDDESAIRAVTEQWLAAEGARDVGALLEHVTDDAVFLMPGGRTVSGKPAIRTLFETFFAAFTSEHTASIAEVRVEGDWAFSWGQEVTVLRPVAGGPPVRLEGFGLSVLRRGPDGRWRFARGINNMAPRPSG
jgi:uncharacterized protein (TIGR02246 family)